MRTRQSICAKKRRFASEEEAGAAAASSMLLLLPYRCDRCAAYHLTSRTKGKRLPGRAAARNRPAQRPTK
jgi:hypothetical protein